MWVTVFFIGYFYAIPASAGLSTCEPDFEGCKELAALYLGEVGANKLSPATGKTETQFKNVINDYISVDHLSPICEVARLGKSS